MLNLRGWGGTARDAALLLAAITMLGMPIPMTIMSASGRRAVVSQLGGSSANLQFDVVSIKPTKIDRPMDEVEDSIWATEAPAGGRRFRVPAAAARALIQAAYKVRGDQIEGAPTWVSSARYNIDAIAPSAATTDEMRSMLRSLLADRFKLYFVEKHKRGRLSSSCG